LIGPEGTEVQLVRGMDLGPAVGEGFSETMFDDSSLVTPQDSTEPYSDVIAPLDPLWWIPQATEDGVDPNGTWTLRVVDNEHGDTGQLAAWSLLLF
jgi:hypothetical protein